MIDRTLSVVVTPFSVSFDALATRIVACEQSQGATDEVMALKVTIAELRKDVDQPKSTDMSMIFRTVEIPNMLVDKDVPPATIGDEVRVEEVAAAESEAETDEEQLGVDEEAAYEGLTADEEAMVDSAVQISLADTPWLS
ncbi:uncharacterized protein LOC125830719 [Solanum verrucosum]|uniref:uncharacterized protein LOC125830719 n=1 Tax=Solanum verrucosum TaxID=315347 RepID=UPI0020D04F43|nr:uncharacterized protein LOC125830719 [Solanum verrucosum]